MRTPLIILFIFGSAIVGRSSEPEELLRQGIDNYQLALETTDRGQRTERFEIAETYFKKAVESSTQRPTAELWINIGNAALGAENLGSAIIAYRRAIAIAPGNEKARQNLLHARSLLPDWVPVPIEDTMWLGWRWNRAASTTKKTWYGIAALLFVGFAMGLVIRQRGVFGEGAIVGRALPTILLVVWCGVLAISVVSSPQRDGAAVVVIPDVIARAADSPAAPARLKTPLPAGVEVTVLEERDNWVRVGLANEQDVWIRRSEIEMI
ncbi:SH3 domain-containing protein [Roseiconus lacunae]|uniref:hypothetical protein n=1 Tax=Roseiconus lacunae TaxID=2605694 RepID=UPI001E595498|nr:hypothetical protein [Roseiconus lacunae]MCD0460553.1 hypothetical protein [Roseiconus lacunae]